MTQKEKINEEEFELDVNGCLPIAKDDKLYVWDSFCGHLTFLPHSCIGTVIINHSE